MAQLVPHCKVRAQTDRQKEGGRDGPREDKPAVLPFLGLRVEP